jgi:hypothetical protein
MDVIRFHKISDIPLPSDGYSPVAKSVAGDGSLLFLSIEPTGTHAITETYKSGNAYFFDALNVYRISLD